MDKISDNGSDHDISSIIIRFESKTISNSGSDNPAEIRDDMYEKDGGPSIMADAIFARPAVGVFRDPKSFDLLRRIENLRDDKTSPEVEFGMIAELFDELNKADNDFDRKNYLKLYEDASRRFEYAYKEWLEGMARVIGRLRSRKESDENSVVSNHKFMRRLEHMRGILDIETDAMPEIRRYSVTFASHLIALMPKDVFLKNGRGDIVESVYSAARKIIAQDDDRRTKTVVAVAVLRAADYLPAHLKKEASVLVSETFRTQLTAYANAINEQMLESYPHALRLLDEHGCRDEIKSVSEKMSALIEENKADYIVDSARSILEICDTYLNPMPFPTISPQLSPINPTPLI